jgi:hypothetical protein
MMALDWLVAAVGVSRAVPPVMQVSADSTISFILMYRSLRVVEMDDAGGAVRDQARCQVPWKQTCVSSEPSAHWHVRYPPPEHRPEVSHDG